MQDEVVVHRRGDVGHVADGGQRAADALAGRLDRLDGELLLAAGEVVVHGTERGAALLHDLLDARGGIALPAQEADRRVEDAFARAR